MYSTLMMVTMVMINSDVVKDLKSEDKDLMFKDLVRGRGQAL